MAAERELPEYRNPLLEEERAPARMSQEPRYHYEQHPY